MEPLVNGQPGPDETWEELAEHSLTHDDAARQGWARTGPGTRDGIPRTRGGVAALADRHNLRSAAYRTIRLSTGLLGRLADR
jgi:hypothetical protein